MALVAVVYSGAHDQVEALYATVNGVPGVLADRGVPVHVDEDSAKRLIEQDTWALAPKAKNATKDES